MNKNLLILVHTFDRSMLTSSVDEILLLRYVNLSTFFRSPILRVEMAPPHLKHMYCFIYIHVETNAIEFQLGQVYL